MPSQPLQLYQGNKDVGMTGEQRESERDYAQLDHVARNRRVTVCSHRVFNHKGSKGLYSFIEVCLCGVVHACTHAHAHTHTVTHTHTHTHCPTHTRTHTHAHTCTHTHTVTHTHICVYAHTHTHTHTVMYAHRHTCTHTHICMYAHTHACTHTHNKREWDQEWERERRERCGGERWGEAGKKINREKGTDIWLLKLFQKNKLYKTNKNKIASWNKSFGVYGLIYPNCGPKLPPKISMLLFCPNK